MDSSIGSHQSGNAARSGFHLSLEKTPDGSDQLSGNCVIRLIVCDDEVIHGSPEMYTFSAKRKERMDAVPISRFRETKT
jgi:hypothetical protein